MAAQQYVRPKGEQFCVHHPKQKLIFECHDCSGQLACVSCVSTVHKRHDLVELEHLVQDKIVTINTFIKNAKDKSLPDFASEVRRTITSLQGIEEHYKMEVKKAKEHGEQMKEEIDVMTVEVVSRLEALLKDTSATLRQHKSDLETLIRKLEHHTEEFKEVVKTGNNVQVHDTAVQVEKSPPDFSLPKFPKVNKSFYIPCKDPKPHIEKGFGAITDENRKKPGFKTTAQYLIEEVSFLDRQPNRYYQSETSQRASRIYRGK